MLNIQTLHATDAKTTESEYVSNLSPNNVYWSYMFHGHTFIFHHSDVIMSTMGSQITTLTIAQEIMGRTKLQIWDIIL